MRIVFALVFSFAWCFARGADAPAPAKPPIKEIGGGWWQVGKVRLNKNDRTAEFPAVINMDNGLAEYLIVHVNGKLHESVLRTDVDPYQVHVAMLLVGAKGAGTNQFPETPDARIPGDDITIEVVWKDGKKEKRMPAELWDQFLERYRAVLLPQLAETRPFFYPFKRVLFWASR